MNKFFAIIIMFMSTATYGLTQEEFSDEDFVRFMYDEPTHVPELKKEHLREYFKECQTPEDEKYNNWTCMKLKVIIRNYIESSQ